MFPFIHIFALISLLSPTSLPGEAIKYKNIIWKFSYDSTLIKNTIKFSLIYKEIQSGAVAKSYMTNGLLIYGVIFAHFLIYWETLPHIWLCNCSTLNFPIYEENLIFFFISVVMAQVYVCKIDDCLMQEIRECYLRKVAAKLLLMPVV